MIPLVSRMVVTGAVHIAIPLVILAKPLGYHTIAIDPREAFATRERSPASYVDGLIIEWLSDVLENLHPDEELDKPALAVALKSPGRHVRALGMRKNVARRNMALRELSVTDEQLARLQVPIGMYLGTVLPDEITLSILPEMVTAKHGLPTTSEDYKIMFC